MKSIYQKSSIPFYSTSNGYNKEELYSRVPRLLDTWIDLSSGYNSQLNLEKSRLDNKLGYTKTLVNTFHTFTRRVKGYTRFVGKYVIGRRKRFLPHKVYIFLTGSLAESI